MSSGAMASAAPPSAASRSSANGGAPQINDKNKDAGALSGHGGKPGKAPAARNKTRGAAGVGHGFNNHPGSSGYDNKRNKNNYHHQKRFPAAKGRGHQNYNTHQPPQHQQHHVAEADEFEVGSVFRAGSKKQNANHLLNFYTERRGVSGNRGDGGRRNAGRRLSGKNAYSGHRYIKEQYLQANCQFVVKSGSDYTVHLNDPDTLVDWDLVEQVGLKTNDVMPSCPICLYPPRAAKVARCGHVFCWPCILHYLALSDDAWRKCPICYAQVSKADLKSVVALTRDQINVGDEIELSLMRRERNSLFAVPVDAYFPEINERHPSISGVGNKSHSQLLLATPSEVARHILAREKAELEERYREDEGQPEVCFIEEALKALAEREQDTLMMAAMEGTVEVPRPAAAEGEEEVAADPPFSGTGCAAAVEDHFADVLEEGSDATSPVPSRHLSTSSDGSGSIEIGVGEEEEGDAALTAEDLDISKLTSRSSPTGCGSGPSPKETFYFYQSSDGQPIFLHALNVQMLVHQYGSLQNCPKKIRGRILEKEGAIMGEELRNKLRYLRHLPVTSNFEVCEVRLDAPLVSKDTAAAFKEQLDARHVRRKKRARDEKRREKRIQVQENKLMGKFPGAKIRIESDFHFPAMGESNADPGPADTSASVDEESTADSSSSGAAVSFARMLRKPSTSSSSNAPAQPTKPKTSTVGPVMTVLRRRRDSDSEPEPEGYVPPPPQASLGDAFAQALNQVQLGAFEAPATGKKGKKGKKNKGVVLLGGAPRPNM